VPKTKKPRFGGTSEYEFEVLTSLRRIVHSMDVHSRWLRLNYDLTGGQLICLLTIAAEGPMTSTQVSKRVHVSTGTLVGILDRLEAKGLIARVRDTRDRRAVYLTATRTGRRLATRAPSPLQASLANALRQLTEKERFEIVSSLQNVATLMGTTSPAGPTEPDR